MTEGVRSDVGRRERMKRGRGMKDREQRSRGMENKQKYMKIKQTEIHENKKIYKKFPQKYYNNKTRMKDNNEVGYIDKSNHCYFRFVD